MPGIVFDQRTRELLAWIQRAVDDARLAAYANVRSYRNLLVIWIIVLASIMVAVPLVVATSELKFLSLGAAAPATPTTTTQPGAGATTSTTVGGGTATPPAATLRPGEEQRQLARRLATIELWGAFGGVIGSLVALRRFQGFRGPYGLQMAQLVLKLPAGALTALFGLVLLQSEVLPPLGLVPENKLAAYAALLGFSQESVTRLVDRRAQDLLGKARSTNDPEKPATGTTEPA